MNIIWECAILFCHLLWTHYVLKIDTDLKPLFKEVFVQEGRETGGGQHTLPIHHPIKWFHLLLVRVDNQFFQTLTWELRGVFTLRKKQEERKGKDDRKSIVLLFLRKKNCYWEKQTNPVSGWCFSPWKPPRHLVWKHLSMGAGCSGPRRR